MLSRQGADEATSAPRIGWNVYRLAVALAYVCAHGERLHTANSDSGILTSASTSQPIICTTLVWHSYACICRLCFLFSPRLRVSRRIAPQTGSRLLCSGNQSHFAMTRKYIRGPYVRLATLQTILTRLPRLLKVEMRGCDFSWRLWCDPVRSSKFPVPLID